MFVQEHVALFFCLCNFASNNRHKAATLNCVPQSVVCYICSEHTVLFLFFLIQSVNFAARLLRLTAFLRDGWEHVALFWCLLDLYSNGTPRRLLHETAFLRNGGKHEVLFLCLCNYASNNHHKAATLNYVPHGACVVLIKH